MKIIYIFIVLLLFIFLSCQQAVLNTTTWKGEIDGVYQTENNKLTIRFGPNENLSSTIEVDSMDIDVSGTYYTKSDYTFYAKLDGSDYMDFSIFSVILIINAIFNPDDISYIDYKLELDGYLNCYNGVGYGDYKMKCKIHYNNGDIINKEFKDDWKVKKQ